MFKPGDKVICIAGDNQPSPYSSYVTGETYEVRSIKPDSIYTSGYMLKTKVDSKGSENNGWCMSRFADAEKYLHTKAFNTKFDEFCA